MQNSDPIAARRSPLTITNGSLRQGNTATFEDIYKAHNELVRRICLHMLRDPIEAEDATQDVFLRVLLKLHTFLGDSALSSWLHRLTTNLVLMRFRKSSYKQASLCSFLDDNRQPHIDVGKVDLNLHGAVDRVDLQTALDLLPDGLRTVFVLHEIQGYAHREIAEFFGYSVGNSKSQLHKARRRLRKLLGGRPDKEVLLEANLNPVC